MSDGKKTMTDAALMAAGLVLVGLCYIGSFDAGWQFDDVGHILNNQAVHVDSISLDSLERVALDSPLKNRPLSYISFALDYRRAGLDPRAFHHTNLALHLICMVLCWLLLREIFTTEPFSGSVPWPRAAALLGALAFGLNPVQTQSVTYIVQRMNLLASMFTLAAVLLWLLAKKTGAGPSRRYALYGLALLAALFGLLCKESAFAVLLIVPALDRCMFEGGLWAWLKDRRWMLEGLALAGLATGAVLVVRGGEFLGGKVLSGYDVRDFTLYERVLTQPRVVIWYATLWLFPAGQRLSIDHLVMKSTGLFHPFSTLLAIVALAAALVYCLVRSERAPLLCLGVLWFLCGLALESSFLPLEMVFEHRLYLPSLGLVMAAAWVLGRLDADWRTGAVVGVVLVLFGAGAWSRNRTWRDMISLWSDAVEKAPTKDRAWANLCSGEYLAGRLSRAEGACRVAIGINDKDGDAWYNMGLSLYRQGRWKEAEEALGRAVEIKPDWAEAMYQLGRSKARMRDFEGAERMLEKAVRLDPFDPVYWYQLGITRAAMAKRDQAQRALEQARSLAHGAEPELIRDIEYALKMLQAEKARE